ncbi:hypothetical protein LAZ67_6001081 [Cordylochernes scorpioides]|uniref:G-protein coupled receptors family 1 profile domain-containing protein n=1 Tax=Cordylochernes scorpioides TaxID=51811 RepID=A0ABY6KJ13_9ARAC|nr:hypothetical protein LAZ67_6001081 [Cordylochernes scorpioides]
MVVAVLLYAAPIWAYDQKELQDVFLRRLLNLPRYTSGYILRMECGRTSLAVTSIKLTMKYWIRILNMEANRLSFMRLTELMNLSRNSNIHIGLVKIINDILNSTGFSYLINCTDKDFLQHELPLITRTAIDQSIQGDWARINNTKLYPHYRNLKKTSLPEGYLSDNLPVIVKRHIAQLRVLYTFFRENHKNIFGEAELLFPTKSNGTTKLCVVSHNSAESQIRARRKAAKMLIAVVVLFALCYMPVHLINALRFTTGRNNRWSSYTPGSAAPNNSLQVRHMSNGHTFLCTYVKSVSVAVSVLTLTFISVDRWYAICHPLRFKSTASRARAAIAVIWVVSAALGIPEAAVLDTRPHPAAHRLATLYLTDCAYTWRDSDTRVHQLCVMVALFVVPLLLMSYLYYKMVRVLWRKEIPGSATTTTTTTAPIWAYDQKELQDVFLHRLLNLPRYTPGYILRMECGRTSLAVTSIKLTMKYWIRIFNMEANRLSFIRLTELMNLSRNSNIHIGLVKIINGILNSTGFSYLINCTDKDFLQHELPLITRTAIDQSIQGDWARINNTKQYPHYRNLKKTSLPEGYLSDNLPFIVKRHIAQLRVLYTFFRENHKNIFGEAELLCPKLQNNIFNILLKFRTNSVALVADIEKMYRQIRLHPDDIKYQTILWRDCKDLELQEYNLLTVTYGLACAPYLAIRTLHQIAHEVQVSNPRVSKIIREDFYVDDLLTGCPTLEDAKGLVQQLIAVLGSGGFVLRKWVSNETSIIEDLPLLLIGKGEVMEFNRKESGVNVLGIQWDPSYDTLNISCKSGPADIKSKRQIVSAIARIYDPCGWLSPTTVVLKLLLQEIWKLKCGWDEDIPASIQRKWNTFEREMKHFQQISIPRYIFQRNLLISNMQMHGFCDSSELAYSAVCYLRITYENNQIETILLTAKTKVAPIKKITIPRLELCAALMLAQLQSQTTQALPFNIDEQFYWTDSKIVLAWITSESKKWQIFVANRVAKIQDLTAAHSWQYISGKQNPADLATRGILPSCLITSKLWWHGPVWLTLDGSENIPSFTIDPSMGLEERHTACYNSRTMPRVFLKIFILYQTFKGHGLV